MNLDLQYCLTSDEGKLGSRCSLTFLISFILRLCSSYLRTLSFITFIVDIHLGPIPPSEIRLELTTCSSTWLILDLACSLSLCVGYAGFLSCTYSLLHI